MNIKISKYIKLLICLLFLSVISACGSAEYNGDGTAQIIIAFDKVYNDVNVSCCEGILEKQDGNYIINLTSRKMIDVVITCPDYETKILNFTTSELSDKPILKTVELSLKKIILKTKIIGISDLSNINITANNGNSIINTEIQNDNVMIFELNNMNSGTIVFKCNGYFDFSFDIKAANFVNYMSNIEIPFIAADGKKVAIFIDNDLGIKDYYIYVTTFDYRKQVYNIDNSTKYFYVDTDEDYYFTDDFCISSKELTELYNSGTPYYSLKLSNFENVYSLKHVEVSIPDKLDSKRICILKNKEDIFNRSFVCYINVKTGDEIIVYVSEYISDTEQKLLSFYKYTITDEDIEKGKIELEEKIENFTTTIKNIDISDTEAVPYNDAVIKIDDVDILDLDDSILLSDADIKDEITLNVTKLLINNPNFYLNIYCSEGYSHYDNFNYMNLLESEVPIYYSKIKKCKILFENENGEIVPACDVLSEQFGYTENEYIINDYLFEGQYIYIPLSEKYLPSFLLFNKKIFDYEDGCYCYTLKLLEVKAIKLNIINDYDSLYDLSFYVKETNNQINVSENPCYIILEKNYIDKEIIFQGYIDNKYFYQKLRITEENYSSGEMDIYINIQEQY